MINKNKKLIIFDFDGVLVDTLGICYSINQEIHDNLSMEEYKSFFTGNVYEAKRPDGTTKKHHPNFFNLYDDKTRELIIPEILKLAVNNLSKKYILAIVSSTYSSSIKTILERENLLTEFSEILGADVHTNKVIKIKMLLEKYSISPKEVIFITDTSGDVKEGKECGVESIAVTWGFHERERLEKGNPWRIIDNPEELKPAILEYFGEK